MRAAILFFFLLSGHLLFGQIKSDTLSQFGKNHKKTGYWPVYLDSNLNICKDTSKAAYYGYNYYENGKLIDPLQQYKNRIRKKVDFAIKPQTGKPVLLTGRYVFYYNNSDNIEFVEYYDNGHSSIQMAFRWDANGRQTMKEVLDYTKPYKNQTGSFYYEKYGAEGELIDKFWFGKKENDKWDYIK
jgi:hypothetical protein